MSTRRPPDATRAALVLVAVSLVWGSVGTVVRQVPLPAAAIAAARVWVATAVLGSVVVVTSRSGPRLFSVRPARLALAGSILAVHWVALFAAYQRMPVAQALFVVYLAPVLMAALASPMLGERIDRRATLALGLALAGFMVLARPAATGGHATATGVALAAFAALTFAAMVIVTKPVAAEYGGVRFAFGQLLVAGVVLVPFAARARWGPPQWSWMWLLVLGALHTAAALAAYAAVLVQLPVARVGTLTYVEPVAAVGYAWVFLGERPSLTTVCGGALVVIGGLIAVTARTKRSATLPAPA